MARARVTIKQPDFSRWKNAIQDLTVKAGLKIEQIAKETAPTDTGNYKSEINYDGSKTVIARAEYSAAIEYGFDNYTENVKAHQRNIKRAFGKTLNPPVVADVKAHTRTMNRDPNPVLRNAAAKVQKEIPQIWQEAQRKNGL